MGARVDSQLRSHDAKHIPCLGAVRFCRAPLLLQMTALMGSSGAGKTTLLDVLAGRKTEGTITGDIRLNGYPKMQKTFTRRV